MAMAEGRRQLIFGIFALLVRVMSRV